MDISAHAEPAALLDARKQRYFLPHSDDHAASQPKRDILYHPDVYDPDVHHDTALVADLHSDIFLDTRTTPAILGAGMIETQGRDISTPSTEPGILASPTPSDSDSVTPASPRPRKESSALPSKSILDKAADLTIIDARGQAIPFKELYRVQPGLRRRVMVIFIRHFFCGNCQEFLRTLLAQMPPASLLADTSIAIIGCGSHTLISSYTELLSCPYPIYADSTKKLFDLLGMKRTLSLGLHAPDYIHHSLAAGVVKSIGQAMKRLPEGDMFKAGDFSQNGGEYLFEVEGLDTRNTKQKDGCKPKGNVGLKVRVTFCHRMRNSRDHTEIPQLVELLGLPESHDRGRRSTAKLERRWTLRGGIGNLARSLSNKRQSWLQRRKSSSSWPGIRRRDQIESSNLGGTDRSGSPEEIETIREGVRSQGGHR